MAIRNRDRIIAALAGREPFQQASMSAQTGAYLARDHQLTDELQAQYNADRDSPGVAYTVYSYSTPIAWVLGDGTPRVPQEFYSVTTSNHQSIAREGLL